MWYFIHYPFNFNTNIFLIILLSSKMILSKFTGNATNQKITLCFFPTLEEANNQFGEKISGIVKNLIHNPSPLVIT